MKISTTRNKNTTY